MRLPTCDSSGRAVEAIEVSDGLFGVPMNHALVHQVAVSHMANARQGTSSTKTRSMVSGGGAKPWRQKHTGRARQGSTRSPQWRGGGVVFGPHPRDYSQRIPKKMNRGAIRCILSQKARDEKILIVKDIRLEQARTREMVRLLANLGVDSPALIVTLAPQKDVILSAKNIKRVKTLPAPQLNPLDLLNHDRVVMTEEAVRRAESLWALEMMAAMGDEDAADEAVEDAPVDALAEDTAGEEAVEDTVAEAAVEDSAVEEAVDTEVEAVEDTEAVEAADDTQVEAVEDTVAEAAVEDAVTAEAADDAATEAAEDTVAESDEPQPQPEREATP